MACGVEDYSMQNTRLPSNISLLLGTKFVMGCRLIMDFKGVHRDCFACGRTCEDCKAKLIKCCVTCRSEYCVPHDEGCSMREVCHQINFDWLTLTHRKVWMVQHLWSTDS